MPQGFGEGHAISFVPGCQNEDIGPGIVRGEILACAGEADAIAEAMTNNFLSHHCRGGGLALQAAGNDAAPGEIGEPGQRIHQQVMALAVGQCPDREQMHEPIANRFRGRSRGVGSRPGDEEPVRRHAIFCDQSPGGGGTGADHGAGRLEGAALRFLQPLLPGRREAALAGEGMMDEADQAQPPAFRLGQLRHGPIGQAIQQNQPTVGQGRQASRGGSKIRWRGVGKTSAQGEMLDGPADAAQLRHQTPVVDVSPRRCLDIARDRKAEIRQRALPRTSRAPHATPSR